MIFTFNMFVDFSTRHGSAGTPDGNLGFNIIFSVNLTLRTFCVMSLAVTRERPLVNWCDLL
jgi:hypothetical protein